MKEGIYEVAVAHARTGPRRQKFLVRGYTGFIDVQRFDGAGAPRWNFHRYNRGDFSLIADTSKPAVATVLESLKQHTGISAENAFLLANPRICGYVFNPVSFFFCYSKGAHVATIVEVNNTFGEQRHYYVPAEQKQAKQKKNFYVSPFISSFEDFSLRLSPPAEELHISINTISAAGVVLAAAMSGRRYGLNPRNFLLFFLKYPFHTLRVITLIHWYALKLLVAKVPFYPKAAADAAIIHRTLRGRA